MGCGGRQDSPHPTEIISEISEVPRNLGLLADTVAFPLIEPGRYKILLAKA